MMRFPLARFGYDENQLLQSHFAQPLEQCGYPANACINEWLEMKLKVRDICSHCIILISGKKYFKQVHNHPRFKVC